jgi:hypothetical protein
MFAADLCAARNLDCISRTAMRVVRRANCEKHSRELTGINALEAGRRICVVFSIVATIRADSS